MFSAVTSVFKNKEIRNRILFTLGMLFIYRFGTAITVPNVDTTELVGNLADNSLLAMMNLLGGGGLEKLSIFALGVGPYITASIILQLLSMDVIPALTELSKSGQTGRKQIDRYTRYLAVVFAMIQSGSMIYAFSIQSPSLLAESGLSGILYIAILLTAGSMFLLWIGDQISSKGIGNGVSMIIFAGIVARMPHEFTSAYTTLVDTSSSSAMFNGILSFAFYLIAYFTIIVLVVFMQTAERKIPIQYTSSTVSMRKKDMTYLPLKINSASVIPVIFAGAIMSAPLMIASFFPTNSFIEAMQYILGMQNVPSLCLYAVLIVMFTFFYTNLQVDPEKISDNLSKSGTYIPGVRPGSETKQYIGKVLNRITVLGAIGLTFIAILPYALTLFTSLPRSMGIGGTGMIIVVGVAMETVKQIQGQMTQKSYRGFLQR